MIAIHSSAGVSHYANAVESIVVRFENQIFKSLNTKRHVA